MFEEKRPNSNLIAIGCTSNVSLNEYDDEASIKILPNPSSTEINLQFNLSKSTELEIFISTLSGQILQSQYFTTAGADIKTLSVNDLNQGVTL